MTRRMLARELPFPSLAGVHWSFMICIAGALSDIGDVCFINGFWEHARAFLAAHATASPLDIRLLTERAVDQAFSRADAMMYDYKTRKNAVSASL